jgi:MFS family permease
VTVFAGLMLGMFLGAINQTIIVPAMPRIIAELGGMEHYSWIVVSALLASTVIVPIVGKLSDLYGRKRFYVGGIVVFMASSLVAGVAPSLETFMIARVLEGFGMGTMMPLSQAIIGDLVPPREPGNYQGLLGPTFGLASVIGPFVGGWITDTLVGAGSSSWASSRDGRSTQLQWVPIIGRSDGARTNWNGSECRPATRPH